MSEELKAQILGEAKPPENQDARLMPIVSSEEYAQEVSKVLEEDPTLAKEFEETFSVTEEDKIAFAKRYADMFLIDRNAYAAFEQASAQIVDAVFDYKESLSEPGDHTPPETLFDDLSDYLSIVTTTIIPLASDHMKRMIEENNFYKIVQQLYTDLKETQDLKPYLLREIAAYNKANPDSPLAINDVLSHFSSKAQDEEDPFSEILKKAKERQKRARGSITASTRHDIVASGAAIRSLNGYVLTPSVDEYMHALTSKRIFEMPGKSEDFSFDSAVKLNLTSLSGQRLIDHPSLNTAYLAAIMKAVNLAEPEEQSTISISVPKFLEESRIDPRPTSSARDDTPISVLRQEYILQKLVKPLDRLIMQMPDRSCYRLAGFSSYDSQAEILRLSVPAFFKLKEEMQKEKGIIPYNRLFHSSIMNEPSVAVELANRILIGVLRRGNTPDSMPGDKAASMTKRTTYKTSKSGAKIKTVEEFTTQESKSTKKNTPPRVTFSIKFSTLIQDCPQIRAKLSEIDDDPDSSKNKANLKNKLLKRAFQTATKIIEEKSDAPARYKDFRIDYKPPTQKTLGSKYTVSHCGYNEDYTYTDGLSFDDET